MKILITGARSYVAYSMLKLAKLQNIEIIIGDSQKKAICFKSGLYNKKMIFPSPRYNFDNFRSFIIEYCRKEKINTIYPTCEEVFYFSLIKSDLEKMGTYIFCDEISKLNNLHSKYNFTNLVEKLPINLPKTDYITSLDSLKKYFNDDKKLIFKYEYSRFANNIFVNFTDKNFKNIIDLQNLEGNLVAQEFINGKKICSFGVAKNGKLLSNICYESKINYKGGSSTYFENISDDEISFFVEKLTKSLNFSGFISFDYIKNDNGVFVIECNPRVTSGIHLFDENYDFSEILFNNEITKGFFPQEKITKTFLLPNIFFNFHKIFKYIGAFSYKNEVLKKEYKLFLYQIFLLFYYLFISIKTSKTISEVSTGDIEFNP